MQQQLPTSELLMLEAVTYIDTLFLIYISFAMCTIMHDQFSTLISNNSDLMSIDAGD